MESKDLKKMIHDAIGTGLTKRAELQDMSQHSEDHIKKIHDRINSDLLKLPRLVADAVANGYAEVQFLNFLNKHDFESQETQLFLRLISEEISKAGYKAEVRREPDGRGYLYVLLKSDNRLKEGKSWLARLLG